MRIASNYRHGCHEPHPSRDFILHHRRHCTRGDWLVLDGSAPARSAVRGQPRRLESLRACRYRWTARALANAPTKVVRLLSDQHPLQ